MTAAVRRFYWRKWKESDIELANGDLQLTIYEGEDEYSETLRLIREPEHMRATCLDFDIEIVLPRILPPEVNRLTWLQTLDLSGHLEGDLSPLAGLKSLSVTFDSNLDRREWRCQELLKCCGLSSLF
jgi:hypothetical protein